MGHVGLSSHTTGQLFILSFDGTQITAPACLKLLPFIGIIPVYANNVS